MTTPPVAPQQQSDGNVFTRKLGPLPMWAWMGLVLLGALLFHLYSKAKGGGSNSQSPDTVNTPGGVDASLVPQFVNQTFDNSSPPPAPNVNVTVNGTPAPKPGPKPKPKGPAPKVSITPGEDFLDLGDLKGTYDLFIYQQPGNKLVYSKKRGTAPSVKVPHLKENTSYYVKILENGQWVTKTVKTGPA